MTEHTNVELTRRAYDAFAKGDLAALSELIADDVTWHVRGVGPLSGDYHGRDEVFAFFGRLAEETAGTFRLDVHDVLANDEHTVALCTLSASRGAKSVQTPVANVSHVRDGKVTEFGPQQPTRRRASTSGPERRPTPAPALVMASAKRLARPGAQNPGRSRAAAIEREAHLHRTGALSADRRGHCLPGNSSAAKCRSGRSGAARSAEDVRVNGS